MRILLMLVAIAAVGHCPGRKLLQSILPKPLFEQRGEASWYGGSFHGKIMANGKKFNQFALTCAHRLLPIGSWIWVESSEGKRVKVMVTDRGPYIKGRILDLSYYAAMQLGMIDKGLDTVKVTMYPESQVFN